MYTSNSKLWHEFDASPMNQPHSTISLFIKTCLGLSSQGPVFVACMRPFCSNFEFQSNTHCAGVAKMDAFSFARLKSLSLARRMMLKWSKPEGCKLGFAQISKRDQNTIMDA